ncbi:MAG: glycoside hydrolase family 15 protein [Actinomycetes bacterium]
MTTPHSQPTAIGEYALIGDLATGALVSGDGSIDWLCVPDFDAPACFAALLGDPAHGRWRIAPMGVRYRAQRSYRGSTLILETVFKTASGSVRLVDFMPPRDGHPTVVRIIEGLEGRVDLSMELRPRFGYGLSVPAVERISDMWRATAGPDTLWLHSSVHVRQNGVAAFSVGPGEQLGFVLMWRPSHQGAPPAPDLPAMLTTTDRYWRSWVGGLEYTGAWRDAVIRSLVTIRALTHISTGGVIAAPTTSVPGPPGSARTWDYRCCRLADASAALEVFLRCGAIEEATAWRDWLLRATAGPPEQIRGVYGPAGQRYRPVVGPDWLPQPAGSRTVRPGGPGPDCGWSVATGELLRSYYLARRAGLSSSPLDTSALLRACERRGAETDRGIWQLAGPRRRHVYSRAMGWVAADATVKMIEWFGLPGEPGAWRRLRSAARTEILRRGVDRNRATLVQTYGGRHPDAALLRLPLLGFLSPEDPLVSGTIEAVRTELGDDSMVRGYPSTAAPGSDELTASDGAMVACSFWMVEALAFAGRPDEADQIFEALLGARSSLGLLAEQHDVGGNRPLGNFPATSAHVALVDAALRLSDAKQGPVEPGLDAFFPR